MSMFSVICSARTISRSNFHSSYRSFVNFERQLIFRKSSTSSQHFRLFTTQNNSNESSLNVDTNPNNEGKDIRREYNRKNHNSRKTEVQEPNTSALDTQSLDVQSDVPFSRTESSYSAQPISVPSAEPVGDSPVANNSTPKKHHKRDDDDDEVSSEPQTLEDFEEMEVLSKYWMKCTSGQVTIPPQLARRIRQVASGVSRDVLRETARDLSETLRTRTTTIDLQRASKFGESKKTPENHVEGKPAKMRDRETEISPLSIPLPPTYNEHQAYAYATFRMPGVYGCTHRVFNEISMTLPSFKPQNMLDFGSGPGTAIWSASQIWKDSLRFYTAVEPSSAMVNVADIILKDISVQRRRYLFSSRNTETYQLVTASYVLSELKNDNERSVTIRNLWAATELNGVLVLVEPGTPIGYKIINDARNELMNVHIKEKEQQENRDFVRAHNFPTKASFIAPCPHSAVCPMSGKKSWCHFSQRVERLDLQKLVKLNISVNWENEKFAYLVVRKVTHDPFGSLGDIETTDNQKPARLIAPPLKRSGHVVLDVCSHTGDLQRLVVSKSAGKDCYKAVRKSAWGDKLYLSQLPENALKMTRIAHDPVQERSELMEQLRQEREEEIEEQRELEAKRRARAESQPEALDYDPAPSQYPGVFDPKKNKPAEVNQVEPVDMFDRSLKKTSWEREVDEGDEPQTEKVPYKRQRQQNKDE